MPNEETKPPDPDLNIIAMSSRRITLSLLFITFLAAGVFSQQSLDSLKTILYSDILSKGQKAITAAEIGDLYLKINTDSAEYYSRMGLEFSLKNELPAGIFKNSCVLGKVALTRDSIQAAISIFEKAREFYEDLDDKSDALCILLLSGYAYDIRRDYFHGHEALYQGLLIAEEYGDSAFLWSYCNNLGAHYIEMEDYEKGLELLRRGLLIFDRLDEAQRRYSLGSTYNNMAIAFLGLGKPDSARILLEKALMFPDIAGNYYGLFNLYGNLGRVHLLKAKPDSAVIFFHKAGIALDSLEGSFSGSTAPLYASHNRYLGVVYYEIGDLSKAREYFDRALSFAVVASDLEIKAEVTLKLSRIYRLLGDLSTSLSYMEEYIVIKDTLDDRKADEKITRLTMEYGYQQDMQEKQQEMVLMDLRHRRRELIYLFAIFTVGGVMITVFLFYLLQRSKIRRKKLEQKAMQLEKDKISEELEFKNKELTTNVLYLLKKNEFISSISERLNEVLSKLNEEDARILKGIITELDKTTDEDTWQEFEVRFKEVHNDFYKRLSLDFPDLTAQDLRLCAFLRLNMTNKEIAAITYQSTDSLKTARYRLRKKLGIDRDENLVAYLTRI
jgi:tetratricopeptide (TPR) repeat protein